MSKSNSNNPLMNWAKLIIKDFPQDNKGDQPTSYAKDLNETNKVLEPNVIAEKEVFKQ